MNSEWFLIESAVAELHALAPGEASAWIAAAAKLAGVGGRPSDIEMLAHGRATGAVGSPVGPLRADLLREPSDRLPWLCRLRRHGWCRWKDPAYSRRTCDRCRHIDLRLPRGAR